MIPKDYVTAWRAKAPWRLDAQVEQDLLDVGEFRGVGVLTPRAFLESLS